MAELNLEDLLARLKVGIPTLNEFEMMEIKKKGTVNGKIQISIVVKRVDKEDYYIN